MAVNSFGILKLWMYLIGYFYNKLWQLVFTFLEKQKFYKGLFLQVAAPRSLGGASDSVYFGDLLSALTFYGHFCLNIFKPIWFLFFFLKSPFDF